MPRKKKEPRLIAVFDAETDPFVYGQDPRPFTWGFYDGQEYVSFWDNENCTDLLLDYLEEHPRDLLLYAHNGGKFDFFYFLEKGVLQNPIKIINGRIVEATLFGRHKLRDSYAILPMGLAAYQKDEIDYATFTRYERDKPENRANIATYLRSDCLYLYDLVAAFNKRFGPKLTIGGTAMAELRKIYEFPRASERHDKIYRQFYFGGRVECFEKGIIKGDFKVYDVNSMYPDVMHNCVHPVGPRYTVYSRNILDGHGFINGKDRDKPYFIRFIGHNLGAFPVRGKTGLDFNVPYGEFFTTSHEFKIALKHGLVGVEKVLEIHVPEEVITFDQFIGKFADEKAAAAESGDKISYIFAKFMMNSAYGKFAQNPDNYFDYKLNGHDDEPPEGEVWDLFADYERFEIWRKPSEKKQYYDVAIACSITGAARAKLLDAICQAKRPIYCDTDSIICEELPDSVEQHRSKLGAWKEEAQGDTLAIAGKKLYGVYHKGECVKLASKGVKLSAKEMMHLAKGGNIVWKNDAPSFKLTGGTQYVKRELNKNGEKFCEEELTTDENT